MPFYAPLFRLDVVHAYFADPTSLRLTFRPDAASAEWIERTECVMRAADNRLVVLYDAEARGGAAAMLQPPTDLLFEVTAEDPLFCEYTAGLPLAGEAPPRFCGGDAAADTDGVWRMRQAVGLDAAVGRPGVHLRLSLPVGGDGFEAGRRYRLDLASRATAWKYILLDDWGEVTPMVVDPAGLVSFAAAAPERVADGRPALAITSDASISLSERPAQRFQLRAANGGGAAGAVLIATLPAAAPGRLGPDGPRVVSEIFVAR